MSREEFLNAVKNSAAEFLKIKPEEHIRIISHLDADGISAASIIIKAMHHMQRKFSATIIPQLDRKALEMIARSNNNVFVFTDLGSSNIMDIEELYKGKKVFVLDHHKPKKDDIPEEVVMVNPHIFGIEGSYDISGAGVTYLFSKELVPEIKDMAYIAITGAIGDVQDKKGFTGLNIDILKDAIDSEKLEVRKGIKLFGYQTRALHKVLEYCNEPKIEGITSNEKGAIEFLKDIGLYSDDKWRTISELKDQEVMLLVEELVKKIPGMNKEDLIWDNYIIKGESDIKELRELSTVLNACGRLGKGSIGVGACLGDKGMMKKAVECLTDYRQEIMKAMEWFNQNRKNKQVIEKKGYIIINAKDKVLATIIGTLASFISRSGNISEGTYVLAMARPDEKKTKISIRMIGGKDIDLRQIIKEICDKLGEGEYGGHKNAAGALIPSSSEEKFIEIAEQVLEKKSMEEGVE